MKFGYKFDSVMDLSLGPAEHSIFLIIYIDFGSGRIGAGFYFHLLILYGLLKFDFGRGGIPGGRPPPGPRGARSSTEGGRSKCI